MNRLPLICPCTGIMLSDQKSIHRDPDQNCLRQRKGKGKYCYGTQNLRQTRLPETSRQPKDNAFQNQNQFNNPHHMCLMGHYLVNGYNRLPESCPQTGGQGSGRADIGPHRPGAAGPGHGGQHWSLTLRGDQVGSL